MKIAWLGTVALCLLGLSVAPAQAQSPTGGVEIGVSMSKVNPVADGQSISRGPGLLAGGWVLFPVSKPVGIQLELVYVQKHTHLTGSTDLKLDYLEVPILAKLKLFKSIYILEGIALGFPVSGKISASGADLDIKNQIHSPDLGLVIGGGVPVSPKVGIEGRYEIGFKQITDTAGAPIQKNASLSVLVRIQL